MFLYNPAAKHIERLNICLLYLDIREDKPELQNSHFPFPGERKKIFGEVKTQVPVSCL